MNEHFIPNFSFAPMIPQSALGSRVIDTQNKEYIDLSGGIAVNALGHCHPELVAALTDQAQKLWHVSNLYTTEPAQQLAEQIVKHTFADKVFFCNSGAEANEAALKLARKYASDHFGSEKNEIIACVNGFHGRTLFTVSVGGQPKYQEGFGPLPQGITHIAFNDVDALANAISEKTCAVIIEPIQGESGVLPATFEFLKAARQLCTQYDALLVFDEVQTGMGRTGKLFAYEHSGVVPDIVSSAKALGSGFPIGAIFTTDKIAPSFSVGTHGSTFGGNPLACAVANKAFEIISRESTLAFANEQSQKLMDGLTEMGLRTGVFTQVRGMGMLMGAVLAKQYQPYIGELLALALEHGVMVLSAGGVVIRLAPSLLITDEDIAEGLQRLNAAVIEFVNQHAVADENPNDVL